MTLLLVVAALAFLDGCLVTWTVMRDKGSPIVKRTRPYTNPRRPW